MTHSSYVRKAVLCTVILKNFLEQMNLLTVLEIHL